jgi:hypothetical protein
MTTQDVFKQAMATQRVDDPMDGRWFKGGKRKARRRARRALKVSLRRRVEAAR